MCIASCVAWVCVVRLFRVSNVFVPFVVCMCFVYVLYVLCDGLVCCVFVCVVVCSGFVVFVDWCVWCVFYWCPVLCVCCVVFGLVCFVRSCCVGAFRVLCVGRVLCVLFVICVVCALWVLCVVCGRCVVCVRCVLVLLVVFVVCMLVL